MSKEKKDLATADRELLAKKHETDYRIMSVEEQAALTRDRMRSQCANVQEFNELAALYIEIIADKKKSADKRTIQFIYTYQRDEKATQEQSAEQMRKVIETRARDNDVQVKLKFLSAIPQDMEPEQDGDVMDTFDAFEVTATGEDDAVKAFLVDTGENWLRTSHLGPILEKFTIRAEPLAPGVKGR